MTDAKSRALLEFPAVRDRLAATTSFAPSRRLAEALDPSSDPVVVRRGLDETDEARALLVERPSVGIGAARDVGASIERAARGGRLEGTNLLDIAITLEAAERLREALAAERRPLLRDLGGRIDPLPSLQGRLELSLDPAGELLDSASPALGGLRRHVRISYERLRSRLDTLVHGQELAGALQEALITMRNGRYVLPVRADARGRVKGIVHDQSASGQTLFVEPLIVVELGNAWREAQLAVQAEEDRILDELSELVGTQADRLRGTLEALAAFDFWTAKARLSAELDAVRAETSERPELELFSARHPLLQGEVVPIDVRLGGDFTALVITGPNTGGKTVALKTIGLLALMHQSGLHVPAAAGSRLPIFPDVFADIGDEQSIAQSLSTFSGHMRSIVRIVTAAQPGALVLLDELGAGTDPTEGSALGQALLDHFIRVGALVAATSHYAELKTYAHEAPQAMNASVEFDLETLSPTYHLSIGLPGTSQAFAIAERLGLPADLVGEARARLSRAQVDFETSLASIKESEVSAAGARERATEAERRAAEARRQAELERARARRDRDEVFVSAREEAERALAGIREEIRAVRAALERGTLTERRLDELSGRLDARLARLPSEAASEAPGDAVEAPLTRDSWAVGHRVRTQAGIEGRIAAIDRQGKRATLEAGGLRLTVALADLVPATDGDGGAKPRAPSAGPGSGRRGELEPPSTLRPRATARSRAGSKATGTGAGPATATMLPTTLDLRGARVEEALELLDSYLDRAAVAGLPRVTVVHGHGSGALRDAVREVLRDHPLVREWRPGERGEGGDGASVVSL
ncbi:MAG TPA: endonuclease MutS2 [Candidatus Limnocylindrales bacterium]|nr:endonuclease MutS2 [Candidatus Limnocylindrales bacterium]